LLPIFIACASSSGNGSSTASQSQKVVGKTSGLEVSVALAATRLGDENCTHDESADVQTKSCAVQPDSGAPRGTGACGGPCKFTNLQLSFTSGAGTTSMHISVASADLLDAASGTVVQTLSAYTPLEWSGASYVAWDETITPASETKASYTLSPPTWSTIDPSNSYSRQYRVRVVLTLDGNTVTLESDALNRDPPVAT
jgi:hypothetical protein